MSKHAFFTEMSVAQIQPTLKLVSPSDLFSKCRALNKNFQIAAMIELCSRQDQESIRYQTLLFRTQANTAMLKPYLDLLKTSIKKSLTSPFTSLEHQVGGTQFISKLMEMPLFTLTEDMHHELIEAGRHPQLIFYTDEKIQKAIVSKILTRFDNSPGAWKKLAAIAPYVNKDSRDLLCTEALAQLDKLNDAPVSILEAALQALAALFPYVKEDRREALYPTLLPKLNKICNARYDATFDRLSIWVSTEALLELAVLAPYVDKVRCDKLSVALAELNDEVLSRIPLKGLATLAPYIDQNRLCTIVLAKPDRLCDDAQGGLVALAPYIDMDRLFPIVLAKLNDSDRVIRKMALDTLATLAPYVNKSSRETLYEAALAKFTDSDAWISAAALTPLAALAADIDQDKREALCTAVLTKLNNGEMFSAETRAVLVALAPLVSETTRETISHAVATHFGTKPDSKRGEILATIKLKDLCDAAWVSFESKPSLKAAP